MHADAFAQRESALGQSNPLVVMFGSEKAVRADAVKVVTAAAQAAGGAEFKRAEAQRYERQTALELGCLLVGLRSAWPERGPNAKGWGEFLRACKISEDRALRYMKLAKDATSGNPVSRSAGNVGAPGIVKMTRDFAKRARALVHGEPHDAGFGLIVAAELRILADELEAAAEAAAGAPADVGPEHDPGDPKRHKEHGAHMVTIGDRNVVEDVRLAEVGDRVVEVRRAS